MYIYNHHGGSAHFEIGLVRILRLRHSLASIFPRVRIFVLFSVDSILLVGTEYVSLLFLDFNHVMFIDFS